MNEKEKQTFLEVVQYFEELETDRKELEQLKKDVGDAKIIRFVVAAQKIGRFCN